jgi:predicted nucleotidyltransferase
MEAKLNELVAGLKAAGKQNVKAVVLYGSAVTGEFSAGHSDLNILCIVEHARAADLENLHAVAEWWIRQGNHAPMIFTLDELRRSADVFAIEILDIKQHHRLLYGEDFLVDFEIPMRLHRMQVERVLRASWLRLRQDIMGAPLNRKTHLKIMVRTLPTFCTLFRHSLIALGLPGPATKREAIAAVASLTGADPSAFYATLDLREGKRKEKEVDVEASLHAYLEFVEVVTSEVDRRLDGV